MATCTLHNQPCNTNFTCTNHEYGDHTTIPTGTATYNKEASIARGELLTDQHLLNMQQHSINESRRRAQNPVHAFAAVENPRDMLQKVIDNLKNVGVNPRDISSAETISVDDASEIYDKLNISGIQCGCIARCTCNNRSAIGLNDTTCGSVLTCGARCTCHNQSFTSCDCDYRWSWSPVTECIKNNCSCRSRTGWYTAIGPLYQCSCQNRCACNTQAPLALCDCNLRCPCDTRQAP